MIRRRGTPRIVAVCITTSHLAVASRTQHQLRRGDDVVISTSISRASRASPRSPSRPRADRARARRLGACQLSLVPRSRNAPHRVDPRARPPSTRHGSPQIKQRWLPRVQPRLERARVERRAKIIPRRKRRHRLLEERADARPRERASRHDGTRARAAAGEGVRQRAQSGRRLRQRRDDDAVARAHHEQNASGAASRLRASGELSPPQREESAVRGLG